MSTNPNNAVGTNGAFGGRTSVNAFNDVLGSLNGRGIISGWALAPSSGMVIVAGGDGSTRDVAVAEDNIGNKTTINNISEEPVPIEIPAAPATGSRIDTVVAYVDNPAQGSATITDNYGACGLIVVSGSASSSPTAPTESDIRTAITADGGAGSVAYYVELGRVTVATGTTDISANMLSSGAYAYIKGNNIGDSTITSSKIANNAVTTAKINNAAVTSAKIDWTTLFLGSPAMGWNDGATSGYVDNRNDGWCGYDIPSFGGAYGTCTTYKGQWGKDQMGGGLKASSATKKGIYLVTVDICAFGEGVDGYKPFRVLKNTSALTGDVGVPMRGGGISVTLITELKANDIINLQIFTTNTNRVTAIRSWCRCYFLRPS